MQQESTEEFNLKVIVCMLTYNHGKFISEAIESVLNQKTNFEYKLLICNDSSTDNTKEIIEKYCSIHGDKIIAVHNKKNLGITRNAKQLYSLAINTGAEYIATLEGDDYWTDQFKLQTQVDFSDLNKNVSLVCANFSKYSESQEKIVHESVRETETFDDNWGDITNYNGWWTKYLTYMIRSGDLKKTNFLNYDFLVDFHLVYELRKIGKIFFYKHVQGVYRVHEKGSFSEISDVNKSMFTIRIYRSILKLNNNENDFWGKYEKQIKKLKSYQLFLYKLEIYFNRIIFPI